MNSSESDGSLSSFSTPFFESDLDAENQERFNQANCELYQYTFVSGETPQELVGIHNDTTQYVIAICLATVAQLKNERKVALAALSENVPAPQRRSQAPHLLIAHPHMAYLIEQSCLSPGQHGFMHVPTQSFFSWFTSVGQFRLVRDGNYDYGVYIATQFHGQAMHGLEFAHLSDQTKIHIVREMSGFEQGTREFDQMKDDILFSRQTIPCLFLQCIVLPSCLVLEDEPVMSPAPESAPEAFSPSVFSVLPSTSIEESSALELTFSLSPLCISEPTSSTASVYTQPSTPSPPTVPPVTNPGKSRDAGKSTKGTRVRKRSDASCNGDRPVLSQTNRMSTERSSMPTGGQSSQPDSLPRWGRDENISSASGNPSNLYKKLYSSSSKGAYTQSLGG